MSCNDNVIMKEPLVGNYERSHHKYEWNGSVWFSKQSKSITFHRGENASASYLLGE